VRVFGVISAADYELGFHAGAEQWRVVLWLEAFLLPLQKIVRQRRRSIRLCKIKSHSALRTDDGGHADQL
jgi:hypothetical protein